MADFHVADYSPWEGWEISAWPTTTILRGQVLTQNGTLRAEPGSGQWLPRKIDSEILHRPAL
jgi:dihydropyrimidinase